MAKGIAITPITRREKGVVDFGARWSANRTCCATGGQGGAGRTEGIAWRQAPPADHPRSLLLRTDVRKERWLAGTDESEKYKLPIAVERSPQLPARRKRDRDREERIRRAGGPKPSLREKAYALARERATVKTCDFTAIGIPRHYLAWMCKEGLLVKVGYGVYRAADREAA